MVNEKSYCTLLGYFKLKLNKPHLTATKFVQVERRTSTKSFQPKVGLLLHSQKRKPNVFCCLSDRNVGVCETVDFF